MYVSQLIWYFVGVKSCSEHTHKTELQYLLGVVFKISINCEPPLRLEKVHLIWRGGGGGGGGVKILRGDSENF